MSRLAIDPLTDKSFEPPVGTGPPLLAGYAGGLSEITWMGRRPCERPHSSGKQYIDCRKWWSKTRFTLRLYQGPTRLRRRKPLHWALSLISYHVFAYYLVDYCTYSRIVGPSGLAGVLNDIINQSINQSIHETLPFKIHFSKTTVILLFQNQVLISAFFLRGTVLVTIYMYRF